MRKPGMTWVLIVVVLFSLSLPAAIKTQQTKIEAVFFSGNKAYSDKKLLKQMLSKPTSFFRRSKFHPTLFADDLNALARFYQLNGFLDAKTEGYADTLIDESKVKIYIHIDEGDRYTLDDVGFLGNQAFSDSLLLSISELKVKKPFNEKDVEASTLKLLQYYANHGFLDANIKPDVRTQREDHIVLVDYEISENRPYQIGHLLVQGYERTRPQTILREINLKSGDVANYSKIIQSQRNIYMTGLFDRVFISTRPSGTDTTYRDIVIDVKEHPAGELSASLGFGSEDKIRSQMELSHQNIQGRARKAAIALHASFIRWGGELSFTDPWFLGVPLQMDFNLMAGYKKEPGYTLRQSGGKITLGRRIKERNRVSVSYQRNWTRLENIKVEDIPEKLNNNQNSLSVKYSYDSRDNLFNPNRGFYGEIQQELGGNFTVHLNRFYRTQIQLKAFHPIGWHSHFGTALEVGWMNSAAGLNGVPLHERFYTGGPNSIRGFKYQRVGPLDDQHVPTGGMVRLIWNVFELRRTVYKNVGLALFLDTGNVWKEVKDMQKLNLRYTPGVGLRMHTVLGMARLDFGFNPDARPYEPAMRVYFSMGQAF